MDCTSRNKSGVRRLPRRIQPRPATAIETTTRQPTIAAAAAAVPVATTTTTAASEKLAQTTFASTAKKTVIGNGNNNNNDNKKRRANNNVECEDATGSVSNVARVYSKTETRKVAKEYLQNATGSNQTVLVPRAVAQTTATDKLDDDVIMTATAEASTKTPTWSVTRGTQTEDPNTVALKNAYHQKKMEDQHTATMTPAQLDEAFLSDAEFERLCAVDELDERCNRILFGAEDDLGLGVSTPKE